MPAPRPFTKHELNERFYAAVAPEAAFGTEVQVGFHQVAVARLVSRHAAALGRPRLRVLELGASTCLFAEAFLEALGKLVLLGEAELEHVEYTAVDYSRLALESALRAVEFRPAPVEYLPVPEHAGDGPETLARLRREEPIVTDLSLVYAEAGRYVREAAGPYDVVLLNELLDDLPWRAFWASDDGTVRELTAEAREDGERWRVTLGATDPASGEAPEGIPAGRLAATSPESVELVRGAAGLLDRGGLMLVHDYGFTERFSDVRQFAVPQPGLPPFVDIESPEGDDVPRSFFRVYGNEAAREIQITSDVAFAELSRALEPTGTVLTIPHGNALVQSREGPEIFVKGDGVFLSELILLTAGDDVGELLASLRARQDGTKERYAALLGEGGRTTMLTDLIYVKA